MGGFSLIHWIILGVVILLLFGGNRFSAMMGDVAKGLKSFKQGMSEEDEAKRPGDQRPADQRPADPQRQIDITPQPRPPEPARSADPVAPPPRDDNAS